MKKLTSHISEWIGENLTPKAIGDGVCIGCNEPYVLLELKVIGGPNKGEPLHFKKGCNCENLQLAKETEEVHRKMEERKLTEEFEKLSLIPPKLKNASFSSYKPRTVSQHNALSGMIKFCQEFDKDSGFNVMIAGGNGVGKSHLSVATTKKLMSMGHKCVFVSVPRLLAKLRDSYNSNTSYSEIQYIELLEKCDLLVLDDLGSDKESDWASEKLFLILDARQGLHTIFTTSKDSKTIYEQFGKDNFSRMELRKENSYKIIGEDMRPQ